MHLDEIVFLLMCTICTVIQAKRGIVVTTPRFWLLGSPETICVSFHDIDFDVSTKTTIISQTWDRGAKDDKVLLRNEVHFNRGTDGCFAMIIPNENDGDRSVNLKLHFEARGGQRKRDRYTFNQTKEILVATGNIEANVTFIETDKPIYKQTDKVQMRILTVTEELKPRTEMIPLVMVQNPLGIRTMQWRNVSVIENQGIAMLDFELLNEPMLGPWKITVHREDGDTHSHTFSVDEYVLPKFEVEIKPPKAILIWEETVPIQICGKYTYGQPVKGVLHLSICLQGAFYRYQESSVQCLAIENIEISGCHEEQYSLRSYMDQMKTAISLYTWDYQHIYLFINATVIEEGTGVKIEETMKTKGLSGQHYDLQFVDTPKEFKPNIKYTGQVKVIDKTGGSVSGLQVELSVEETANKVPNTTYTTDSHGKISFFYTDLEMKNGSSTILIKARLIVDEEYGEFNDVVQAAEVTLGINMWYSPSNSFLQIDRIPDTMKCGETFGVHLPFSNQYLLGNTLYYKIIVQKRIVSDGQIEEQDASEVIRRKVRSCLRSCTGQPDIDVDMAVNSMRDSPCMTLCLRGASVNFTISLPEQEWGDANLIVYTVTDDGEVVADSTDFKIEYCLHNNVTMTFSEPLVAPGEDITLSLAAQPNSICAYGVMDKSIQLLAGKSTTSLKEITNRIPTKNSRHYYGGYYGDDFSHCEEQAEEEEEDDDDDDDEEDEEREKEDNDMVEGNDGERESEASEVEAVVPEPTRPPRRKRPRGKRPRGQRRKRPRRSIMPYPGRWYSRYTDSSSAFQKHNLVVLSDLIIHTRPCEKRQYQLRAYSTRRRHQYKLASPGLKADSIPMLEENEMNYEVESVPSKDKVVDTVRSFFPETWLWDLLPVGDTGRAEVTQSAPDTITEWVGHAVCTSRIAGLGISTDVSLKTFQPFFVSLSLPYSVIRGETLILPVSVFNYLTECLVISIEMLPSTEYEVGRGRGEICVCGQEKVTHQIPITARTLGLMNITVTAESVEDVVVCGNVIMSSQIGVRDTVIRELLVEAEGKEEEYAFGSFMCPEGTPLEENKQWTVPSDIVSGSLRTYVSAMGDVMGPALSGLDSLLKLPTGCGEQNMLKFAPNIYILQYLKNTNQLNKQIESKALGYMTTGYRRELQYRHPDGSYSAFGSSDDSGSTWLTAFVLKSFSQAANYIDIDEADLNITKRWFENNQLENGCFRNVGRVLHKGMKGGLAGDAATLAPLTAYGLVALLEAGYDPHHEVIRKVVECLTVQEYTDVYSAALVSYAYSLLNKNSIIAENALEKLNQFKTEEDGGVYWKVRDSSMTGSDHHAIRAVDVETTAYALLAHMNMAEDPLSDIPTLLPIVRWLTAQRNPNGGFLSTQDTVVALQALAEFAAIAQSQSGDVIVNVKVQNDEHNFMITEDNNLVLQKEKLETTFQPGQDVDIYARTTGNGCAFVQTSMKYNILNITQGSTHNINLEISTSRTPDNICYRRIINVCIRYEGPDEATNMALLDVKMVTGWSPIKESVEKLLQSTKLHISRYEIEKKNVNLYFTELTRDQDICLEFGIEQDIPVHNPKPGTATVYDYYDQQEVFYQKEYTLRSICGTKEELPFDLPPQTDVPVNEIEQVRKPLPSFTGPGPVGTHTVLGNTELNVQEACPVCYGAAIDGEELKNLACNISHVYKGMVKRPGLLKLHKDLVVKKKVNKITSITQLDHCSCPTLDKKMQWVWVMTASREVVEVSRRHATLDIASGDVIIPVQRKSKALDRLLRRAKKSKKCRRSRG